MKNTIYTLLALSIFTITSLAFADDAETQAKDKASDVKTDTSKSIRKGKRNVRKATGNDTTSKDASDTVGDVKDDANNSVEKAKNHTQ